MFGSETIEVVIGVVFIYFLISLLCTTITEWFARMIKMRAASLRNAIFRLLTPTQPEAGKDFKPEEFFNHPLITGLQPKSNWYWRFLNWIAQLIKLKASEPFPSSISPRTFSLALVDMLENGNAADGERQPLPDDFLSVQSRELLSRIEASLKRCPKVLSDALTPLLNEAKTKTDKWNEVVVEFQKSVEKWFDTAMERLSGQYKRKAQAIVMVIAVVLCFGWNVDTLAIANSLYQDASLRATVAAAAEARVQEAADDTATPAVPSDNVSRKDITKIVEEAAALELPIGWPGQHVGSGDVPEDAGGWLMKVLGILATVTAVSLGSTFWFDLLNKLVNLRAAGKKPAESETPAGAEKT